MAVYYLTEGDVAELEGKGAALGPHGPLEVGMAVPAVVTRMYGLPVLTESGETETRTVYNLQVLLDGEQSIWRQDVPQEPGRGGFALTTVDVDNQAAVRDLLNAVERLTRRLDALTAPPQGEHAAAPDTPAAPSTPPSTGQVA
jgi:hypothetical protein